MTNSSPYTGPYDEKILLSQVAGGDEGAFTELYHYWQPFLSSHICRITESRELTEEILQDVFLKIWLARETVGEIRHFKSFLLVVSKNHALNALQKRAREYRQRADWAKEQTGEQDGGEGAAAAGRTRAEGRDPKIDYYSLLDEAIDQLSPRQKQVYLLHRHGRFTYNQVAEKLGIGKESVKTHLELAVKRISEYVKREGGLMVMLLLLHY